MLAVACCGLGGMNMCTVAHTHSNRRIFILWHALTDTRDNFDIQNVFF